MIQSLGLTIVCFNSSKIVELGLSRLGIEWINSIGIGDLAIAAIISIQAAAELRSNTVNRTLIEVEEEVGATVLMAMEVDSRVAEAASVGGKTIGRLKVRPATSWGCNWRVPASGWRRRRAGRWRCECDGGGFRPMGGFGGRLGFDNYHVPPPPRKIFRNGKLIEELRNKKVTIIFLSYEERNVECRNSNSSDHFN